MSDLHLEFLKKSGKTFVDDLPVAADTIVLAGDIFAAPGRGSQFPRIALETIKWFAGRWPIVVYTPGNHEYYSATHKMVAETMAEARATYKNFYPLMNGFAEIEGQRFIGGTLWFDKKRGTTRRDKESMNDFRTIPDFEDWVYEENKRLETLLDMNLTPDDIVVTHHLPSFMSVHQKYAISRLNRFFVHNLEHLILDRQPKVWIHGHTHESADYTLGKTRVVCNPRGYPHEASALTFQKGFVIDPTPI